VATDRTSPPTRRVLGVLNLLAADPANRRTLTAIATALELSPATCLGILNELTAAGYLVRHPDRTYSLGGTLVSVGAAARDSRPGIARARGELRVLSDALGRLCTASAVIGDQIVVLEVAGGGGGATAPIVRPGARFPFTAPIGLVNAAWYGDEVITAWIDRSPVSLGDDKLARLRSVVATCRQQGYLVERLTNVEADLHRLLPLGFTGADDDAARRALGEALLIFADRDYLTDELDEPEASVSVICAPCFDADGRPELTLGVYVMEVGVPIDEIHAIGRRLRAACDRVTAGIGGHDPWW
jgi:DNA-binding IclR family transcriptional regulator